MNRRSRWFFSFHWLVIVGAFAMGSSVLADPPAWINMTNDLGGDAPAWARFSALTMGAAPGTDTVYVHVGGVGLFASKHGGAHWTNTQAPPATSPIDGYVSNFVFDPKDP